MVPRLLIAIAALGLLVVLGVLLLNDRGEHPSPPATAGPISEPPRHSPSTLLDPAEPAEARQPGALPAEESHPSAASDPASARVSGVVLDAETGNPIERFEIVHAPTGAGGKYVDTMLGYEIETPHPSRPFARTDGRFALHDLPAGWTNLGAIAGGYSASAIQIVEIGPGLLREDFVFRLHRAATVRGRVIAPATGAPVVDALVAWLDDAARPRTGPAERFARTDAFGRFTLESVLPGTRRLVAAHETSGQGITEPLELEPVPLAEEIVIALEAAGAIEGRLVPEAGKGALPLDISLWPLDPALPTAGRLSRPAPDRFRADGLFPGTYRFVARSRSEMPIAVEAAVEAGSVTRVELARGESVVRGRVLRGAVTVPFAAVELVVAEDLATPSLPETARRMVRTKTTRDGAFAIEGVPEGEAVLSVRARTGGPASTARVEVARRRSVDLDLRLGRAEVRGSVRFTVDGARSSDFAVAMIPTEGPTRSPAWKAWAELDPDGRYRIEDVPPGTYVIALAPRERARSPFGMIATVRSAPLTIADGESRVHDFTLDAGGTAVVAVKDGQGQPAGCEDVQLRAEDGAVESGETQGGGQVRIPWIPPGEYAVALKAPDGRWIERERRRVESGAETRFDLRRD